ncbi:EmrB/QacA subfamily drug resistance transporter [Actinocorallia herbida]|uniref:EmrB/QacA subfamily drug resistance transporter n=1 Tax=Actinocorallia herbida TaxID=58109 RepID=A0A3N1DAJ3_9ACTN|nr:MFS transporter [Actinocorallia herbida]ROO90552.1 EmrB/QacA subfamily drug resistance transporter [Actinocorallia herbida]
MDLQSPAKAPAKGEAEKAPRKLRSSPWAALAAVAFGLFMVGLDGSVVSVANPYIGAALDTSLSQLQWVTNAYLLALAALLVLGGKLGDRYGRRRFFLIGLVGFTVTSAIIGLVGSIEGVIVFRALQGAFGALLMPNTLGILRAVFPPRRFGIAVGIWAMVSSVSTALGPIIGGALVEQVGWEWVFYINVPIGVIGLVYGLWVLPETRNSTGHHRFDVPGVILLALGMVALVFGIVKGESWGWSDGRTYGVLILGLVLLLVFGLVENRTEHPLLPMRLFRNPSLTVGTLITAINFFTLLGSIFFIMLYQQNVRGHSALMAGVLILPLSIASVVASPVGAALTDRFGPRLTMPLGMVLQGASALTLMLLAVDSSYHLLWPPFVGLGLGVGMVMAASSEAIVGNAPVKDAGVAGGLQATALQIGGALGTSVLLSVLGSRAAGTIGSAFTDAGVPADVGAELTGHARETVALGVALVPPGADPGLATAITQATGEAFVTGVHAAAGTAGALCLIGAVVAIVVVRRGQSPVDVPAAH